MSVQMIGTAERAIIASNKEDLMTCGMQNKYDEASRNLKKNYPGDNQLLLYVNGNIFAKATCCVRMGKSIGWLTWLRRQHFTFILRLMVIHLSLSSHEI